MRNMFLLGSSGDIGRAIRNKFITSGYSVIAPTHHELDIGDTASIDDYFSAHPPADLNVNIIIHSVGINSPKPFEQLSKDEINRCIQVNTTSFLYVVQRLVPRMIEQKEGAILAISSLYGQFARSGRLPYVVSKHALNGAVKTLAIELGRHNIRVNCLSPGFVDTKMTRKNNSPEDIRSFKSRIPLGRLATTTDIAEVAFFLCSPANQYINGQDIVVDGGYSVGGFQN